VLAVPGAGAAGGLGAGLIAFCGATITSGVDLIAALAALADKVRDADLVLTGEGSFDGQTARGKAPSGVARIATEIGVPVVVVAGRLSGSEAMEGRGVASFCVSPGPMELSEAVRDADYLLKTGTARLIRLLGLCPVRDLAGAD
jgi:glycerate kinase